MDLNKLIESLNHEIFQGTTTFVAPDLGKTEHYIPIPAFICKEGIAQNGTVIEVKDIGEGKLNLSSEDIAKLCLYYKSRVPAEDDLDTAFNKNKHGIRYSDFYAACRVIAFTYGWVSPFAGSEAAFFAGDDKDILVTEDKLNDIGVSDISKLHACFSLAINFHVAKAINYWATNHSLGQGGFTRFWIKVIMLLDLFDDASLETDIADIYSSIYNAIHFSDNRNILDSISLGKVKGVSAAALCPIRKIALDAFATIRLNTFPAGCSGLAYAQAVLPRIINSHFQYFMGSFSYFDDYFRLLDSYRANPSFMHVGAYYLNKRPDGTSGIIAYDKTAIEEIAKSCISYVLIFSPNSTLIGSQFHIKHHKEKYDDEFDKFCQAMKNDFSVNEQFAAVIKSISSSSVAKLLANADLESDEGVNKARKEISDMSHSMFQKVSGKKDTVAPKVNNIKKADLLKFIASNKSDDDVKGGTHSIFTEENVTINKFDKTNKTIKEDKKKEVKKDNK